MLLWDGNGMYFQRMHQSQIMIAITKQLKWGEAHAIVHGAMVGPVNYCMVTVSSITSTSSSEN